MKRFILLIVILVAQSVLAVERPTWEENCPQGLQNVQYKEIQWYWPESTKATQEIYNYWAMRREEFKDSIAICDFMSKEFQDTCYEKLRSKQEVDNELYRMKLENKKISSQIWRDTTKMTNPVMFNIITK
jgi:hypothetical protein